MPCPSVLLLVNAEQPITVGGRHDEVAIAIIPGSASSHHLVDQVGGSLCDMLLVFHLPHFLLEGIVLGQLRRSLLFLEQGLLLLGFDLGLGAAALATRLKEGG